MIEVRTCALFRKSSIGYARDARVRDKIRDFIKFKSEQPMQPFGAKDKLFASGSSLRGYYHAGLTFDVSIVYKFGKADGQTTLDLYAVYSHDELGSGSPPNQKRQDNAASRFANQDME